MWFFSATFNHDPNLLTADENFIEFYMVIEDLIGRKIDLVDEDKTILYLGTKRDQAIDLWIEL